MKGSWTRAVRLAGGAGTLLTVVAAVSAAQKQVAATKAVALTPPAAFTVSMGRVHFGESRDAGNFTDLRARRGKFTVIVSNCDLLPRDSAMFQAAAEITDPEFEDLTPGRTERSWWRYFPKYPSNAVALKWTIADAAQNFTYTERRVVTSKTKSPDVPGLWPCRGVLRHPGAGTYTVSLTWEYSDRAPVTTSYTQTVRRHWLVAVIGDSYASGEGNPEMLAHIDPGIAECEWTSLNFGTGVDVLTPALWVDPGAHRSFNSVIRAASVLPAENEVVTAVSFAVSGAKTDIGLLQPQPLWEGLGVQPRGQLAQLRHAVMDQPIDALIVSIGGNDVLFSNTLRAMALGAKPQQEAAVRAEIARLPGKMTAVKAALDGSGVRVGRVFLLEYPTAFFDAANDVRVALLAGMDVTAGCGVFETSTAGVGPAVTAKEAATIKRLATELNDTLRVVAERAGWTYVTGIASGFARHGYCSGQSYFVGAEQSCRDQGNLEGTMHPNTSGQTVYRNAAAAALNSHFHPQRAFTPVPILPVRRPGRMTR